MNIEKMRGEFEAAFMRELEVDLSGNRHIDGEGLDCYQFDGDDEDERSKLASIAFMFWQQSRAAIEVELPKDRAGLFECMYGGSTVVGDELFAGSEVIRAIEAAGLKVKP